MSTDFTVSASDLQVLADTRPDAPSQYCGVYPERDAWVARAFKRRVGPPQPTPRAAAILLVQWWKRRYGERWREAWHYRQTAGWVAVRCRAGVWAVAEVCGQASVTVGVGPDGRACEVAAVPGCRPFADTAAAAAGVREWAAGVWGADGRYAVRRTWAEEQSRGRRTPVPCRV